MIGVVVLIYLYIKCKKPDLKPGFILLELRSVFFHASVHGASISTGSA